MRSGQVTEPSCASVDVWLFNGGNSIYTIVLLLGLSDLKDNSSYVPGTILRFNIYVFATVVVSLLMWQTFIEWPSATESPRWPLGRPGMVGPSLAVLRSAYTQ